MRGRAAAAILTAALLGAACGTGPPDHVRIGLVAPLSGERAALGQESLNGARIAVDDINRDGGLLGAPVELVVHDDAALVDLPGQLADLAERQRVTAIIGPESPGILLGARSPLARRQVPALLPAVFAGDVTTAPTTVLRLVPSARDQGEALGRWLSSVRGIPAVALLVADPVEGGLAEDDVVAGLRAGGVDVRHVVSANPNAVDLGPSVAALRRAAPDVGGVVLWGSPASAARATLAVRRQDWDVQVAVAASAFVSEYRTLAGAASESVVLAFPYRREWFSEGRLTSWLVQYHLRHGLGALPELQTLVIDVPVAAAAAYDGVLIVADAVRRAGTREPAAVAAALSDVEVDGLLRPYRLDGGGEVYAADELFVARFHQLATVYDADPRLDPERQRRLWEGQVNADYVPQALLDGPARALIERLLGRVGSDARGYVPPLPGPGPVGRPVPGPADDPAA